ncbi:hypothetical protein TNCT_40201 [Trichonephila clavata]|uniref:Uncharacterized protein n=1 Tax=Trichonephila clavata TaxID=2740835 RepID=A0A8X6F9V6_TRICU|nr:hypothetical protein TNCT_40201 [Trichonephila clavata]
MRGMVYLSDSEFLITSKRPCIGEDIEKVESHKSDPWFHNSKKGSKKWNREGFLRYFLRINGKGAIYKFFYAELNNPPEGLCDKKSAEMKLHFTLRETVDITHHELTQETDVFLTNGATQCNGGEVCMLYAKRSPLSWTPIYTIYAHQQLYLTLLLFP